ncbi:unnamed protein product [Parajaminaea phylloscopi]
MTVLFAPARSSNTFWQSPSLTPAFKRKRSPCGSEVPTEHSWNTGRDSLVNAPLGATDTPDPEGADGPAKRTRTLADAATTDPRHLPSSSANVPFSSDFRNSSRAPPRPPTVEEQQSWASSSTQPSSSPPSGVYAGPMTSPPASSASTVWTKVTTDYGHAWQRCDEAESYSDGSSSREIPMSSLWSHVEGDADMDLFDPDTSRRGDTFAWDDNILQLRVPTQAHAHPYSPAYHPHEERAQKGATYFDQAVWQAQQADSAMAMASSRSAGSHCDWS